MTPSPADLAVATSSLWAGWIGAIAAVIGIGVAIYFGVRRRGKVNWSTRPNGGERWDLVNDGPGTVYDVRVAGLGEIDQRRLTVTPPPRATLAQAGAVTFDLVSRLSISGPANVVVTYRRRARGPELQEVVPVDAP
ncbi:hypothetical protein NFX31_12890 [Microbacterium azadirachtae]|uniref:hypothetical protein n=1 Tax=Microbacterium azadirachtae TaxID=582680 RepID=UPI0021D4DCE5|nr:hypothetical protein [Microbacterium azadirachtae]UXW85106.1 hypothetical protein NFX31_12890 [Microbacterium azadirachtae]